MTDDVAGGHPEWSPEWLADVVIDAVAREATEPGGVALRDRIAGLFRQFAAKAVAAERERCAKLVEGYDPDRVYHSDADGNEFPAGIDWDLTQSCLAKYIREGT